MKRPYGVSEVGYSAAPKFKDSLYHKLAQPRVFSESEIFPGSCILVSACGRLTEPCYPHITWEQTSGTGQACPMCDKPDEDEDLL